MRERKTFLVAVGLAILLIALLGELSANEGEQAPLVSQVESGISGFTLSLGNSSPILAPMWSAPITQTLQGQ